MIDPYKMGRKGKIGSEWDVKVRLIRAGLDVQCVGKIATYGAGRRAKIYP